ncbi:MAG: hypothetical protein Q4A66_06070, partial [Eubacteriales bacterium]|nr:hypothetical protein [Eubacteriales bacterium]
MRTTPVRRIAALLMSIFMLVGMLPAFAAAVCPLCGGTNVTQEAVESVRIHGNGDGTHTTTKVTTVLTYCSDCQVTSDAQETLGASETTDCVYPEEGGVCEACLTTPCGHSAAMLDQIWIGMGYTCEPLNKEFHALYSNAVLADVCMECEEIVRYYEDSAESEYIENE